MTVLTLARLQLSTWPWPLAVSNPYIKQRCPIELPSITTSCIPLAIPLQRDFQKQPRENRGKQNDPVHASQAMSGLGNPQVSKLEPERKRKNMQGINICFWPWGRMRKSICKVKMGTLYWLQWRKKGLKRCQISRGMTATPGIPTHRKKAPWKKIKQNSMGAKGLVLMAGSSALGKEKPAR